VGADEPFLEHAFLAALEASRSVSEEAGCVPRLVLAWDDDVLVGAVPLYLKHHSYGEFVFDWAWAGAAQRAGLAYYPKLVAFAPYTPATGRRLLTRPDRDPRPVWEVLLAGIIDLADQEKVSSVHVLFCSQEERAFLAEHAFLPRLGLQFHWHNRPEAPFASFDDFLGTFRAPNRKQVRKERRVALEHGLRLATLTGPELGDREWHALSAFYETNIEKHGGSAYLTPAFFRILRATYAHRVVATFAYRDDRPVAGTLNFEKGRALFGRYWGCLPDEERPMLHFELCYYQLIERAVRLGHTRFEAGAQGEHKLKRGLGPTPTYSAHWLRHAGLQRAVSAFLDNERALVENQIADYQGHSPFRRDDPGSSAVSPEGSEP
jgi:predicted N-acyltransferase